MGKTPAVGLGIDPLRHLEFRRPIGWATAENEGKRSPGWSMFLLGLGGCGDTWPPTGSGRVAQRDLDLATEHLKERDEAVNRLSIVRLV